MAVKKIKNLLMGYYDIPQKKAEEFATIRNCDTEKNKITLPCPSTIRGCRAAKAYQATVRRAWRFLRQNKDPHEFLILAGLYFTVIDYVILKKTVL